jgi:hypothetical protein
LFVKEMDAFHNPKIGAICHGGQEFSPYMIGELAKRHH